MKEVTDIHKRWVEAVEHVLAKELATSKKQLAEDLTMTQQSLTEILGFRMGVSPDLILRLNLAYNVSFDFVFKNVKPIIQVRDLSIKKSNQNTAIPITDIKVAAGGGYMNPQFYEKNEFLELPKHLVKTGSTYLSLKIKGDSMAPTYQDGSYAISRLLDKSEWEDMRDGRVYVVVDTDGKGYIKRVKNRLSQGFIVCMSDNPDKASHPNFNVDLEDIVSIWYVEWYLSPKFPNIHDQYYSRLQRIEDMLEKHDILLNSYTKS